MNAEDFFRVIVDDIHTTIVATADDGGRPITAAIDMMAYDRDGLYFLTAKGKNFYSRLKKHGYLSLTAIKGKDTLSRLSITIRGYVEDIGGEMIPYLFERNQYMYGIYPDEESRKALAVFRIYKGLGELFDLSKHPIWRESFSFGGAEEKESGYMITDRCTGCRACIPACPQSCIDTSTIPFRIRSEHCLSCGRCSSLCPEKAIRRAYDT